MSFGGGGSGFSFGASNNQPSTFGGFGNSSNNNTSTFGATSNSGGFGNNTTSSNPFGGGATGSGGNTFGANTGGFGTSSNTGGGLFGNKTGGTGLFGSTTNTASGGGLFGNTPTNTNTSTGFGSSTGGFGTSTNNNAFGSNSNTGFGGFGNTANKPAFGSSSSGGTTLFGQGGSGTTGGFGSSGNAFGGSGTALGQNVPPSQGTAVVPFAPTTEKDPQGTTQNFQSINFMEPYQKYSFEELRLADYNAGRRFGNGTGQPAGGFGTSSTFGGFGANNTSTGGFGSNTQTNNPFGSNTASTGGFGSNSSSTLGTGGLFGQNKPAGGGLFGQQQSSGTSTGGLFGTANNNTSSNPFSANTTSTGFGSNTGGGGLFGSNSTQQQTKPGGLFGNTSTTTSTPGFSFGNNNNQQQSGSTGGGLFGNNQQSSGGGLFGNNNTANQQQKPAGGLFGSSTGGGFGNNSTAQTSGGLFGTSSNTGGGLFGNNNASTTGTTGGVFGNTQSNSTGGGGLFGNSAANNQSKPGGLFGNSTFGNNQQQGGGLFGNNNQQPSTGSGLFNTNNNTNNNAAGGFSFGGSQNKPAGGSMFGNLSTNNTQGGGLFNTSTGGNSMFGNSMGQTQQAQQQSDVKHASLLDTNPYGQSSIWTGLPAPTEQNSQPLVTVLTATQKLKESQSKPPPNLRLNQSRYMTPPRRGGYGFTYSTYGTPNSAASTPGGNSLSTSMYGSRFTGGSFGRSLGKSASISNMRSYYSDGESVLAPGAFTPSSSRYSSGSIRRLTIDRSIRDDLFSRPALPAPSASVQPSPTSKVTNGTNSSHVPEVTQEAVGSKLKKRVSFDKETTGGENGELNGNTGAVIPVDDDAATVSPNGTISPVEQAPNNGLTTVPEDRESEHAPAPRATKDKTDPQPGEYWMKPTMVEIARMSRDQAANYKGLQVGRTGCGYVTFDGAVDLKSLPPQDELFDTIINIGVRSITVYPESSTKPPRGKGLNVPSTLRIENSWPRARGKPEALASGPAFDKHIKRLKNIHNTEFVSYDINTGVWVFKVQHYTRYGLDYDDDDEDDFQSSQLSAPPESIKAPGSSVMEIDSDYTSEFGEDDTFQGKQLMTVPGGFGKRSAIDDVDESIVRSIEHDSPGSEQSTFSEDDDSDDEVTGMAGAYPAPSGLDLESPNKPELIPGTPGRPLLDIDLDGDWAEQLQRTISPRKQNRDALREVQSKVLLDREFSPMKPGTIGKKGFRTSIDVMNAIFDKRGTQTGSTGFEFPYAKRAKTFDPNDHDMTDADKSWHASFKPSFTPVGKLILKSNSAASGNELWKGVPIARSHNRTITAMGLKPQEPLNIVDLMEHASIELTENGVPEISYTPLPFNVYATSLSPAASANEVQLYELLHVLFDNFEDSHNAGLDEIQREDFADRIRKERLSSFLSAAISQVDTADLTVLEQRNPLEAALRHLARGDADKSSDVLYKSRNPTLALLVAQGPNVDQAFQASITEQISNWREQSALSEMDLNVRALYELLAGNTTVSRGIDSTVEHKAVTFSISSLLGLNWLNMFALSLWFGPLKTSPVSDIIADFASQLSSGAESASPLGPTGAEDPLWVVLKLYASVYGNARCPTFPQALSALSTLGTFNSLALFRAYNIITSALPVDIQIDVDDDVANQLASDLSFELEAKADVPAALLALLHLTSSESRATAVVELLLRNAARLPLPPTQGEAASAEWSLLTQHLAVPPEWLYQALAQLRRAEGDAEEELRFLILADEREQAHECLVQRVAPVHVVDEDWEGLKTALALFAKGSAPDGWRDGGAVFEDFLALVTGMAKTDEEKAQVLRRLTHSLAAMDRELGGGRSGSDEGVEDVRRRVSVREMTRVVAAEGTVEVKELLDLPITREVKGQLGSMLAGEYYRKVMAGRG
ncbi:uncharacterized protein HMPREF1541_02372 [Cyphellophora europaea CBS 101466]|uniref:Peptidase S59 domain-containing protein n=1 Tax=Cyphellophora europaea (strain CBS 101466) TaxID=1220924 RepID=W2S588_CYPE1|nr:uncharacterized protein HMPREF1541_02372 [Cyphellophora europaea CBS 101466]ETN43213.1 hypothetical protein HMPREF1541_02372 [Cyphellophora europaea CBS 101466]